VVDDENRIPSILIPDPGVGRRSIGRWGHDSGGGGMMERCDASVRSDDDATLSAAGRLEGGGQE
jgi:hypothetical protein